MNDSVPVDDGWLSAELASQKVPTSKRLVQAITYRAF